MLSDVTRVTTDYLTGAIITDDLITHLCISLVRIVTSRPGYIATIRAFGDSLHDFHERIKMSDDKVKNMIEYIFKITVRFNVQGVVVVA